MVTLQPIATVHSPVTEGIDEGWGDVVSEIVFEPACAGGLRGIEDFSHVLVIFLMHESTFDAASDLVRRPRGLAEMPETGIFAQRAKHRPNPIGVTAVEVVGRDANILRVRGLDAIDGTPVLDVKPYVPAFDRIEHARVPEWMQVLMRGYF